MKKYLNTKMLVLLFGLSVTSTSVSVACCARLCSTAVAVGVEFLKLEGGEIVSSAQAHFASSALATLQKQNKETFLSYVANCIADGLEAKTPALSTDAQQLLAAYTSAKDEAGSFFELINRDGVIPADMKKLVQALVSTPNTPRAVGHSDPELLVLSVSGAIKANKMKLHKGK